MTVIGDSTVGAAGEFLLAGRYGPEAILDPDGALLKNSPVAVGVPGSPTPAVLYADKTKAATIPNPVYTDNLGNLTFYAVPGDYTLQLTIDTILAAPIGITVDPDPSEVEATGTLVGGSGRPFATIVVAASDSVARDKANADFVCGGATDESTIQAALDQADSLTTDIRTAYGTGGCKVVLLDGYYNGGGGLCDAQAEIAIEGMGPGTHLHNMAFSLQANGSLTKVFIEESPADYAVSLLDDFAEVGDLWIAGLVAGGTTYGVYGSANHQRIYRVRLDSCAATHAIYAGGAYAKVTDSDIKDFTGTYAIYSSGAQAGIGGNLLSGVDVTCGIGLFGANAACVGNVLPLTDNTFSGESINVPGSNCAVVGNVVGTGATITDTGTDNQIANNP